jgi:hypothetical protein
MLATSVAISLVGLAPTAWAHEGNENYRSEVTSVTPDTPGIQVDVLNFDDSLRLTNNSGLDVEIEGYEEEPYARILADGTVEVNRNSPAYYLNDDRFAESEVPEGVDADEPPDWEVVDESSMFSWHDHRMHWMSTSLPPQVTDESERTKIFDYSIPIAIAGDPGKIEGTLTWVGKDPGVPLPLVFGLGALVVLVAVGSVYFQRRRNARAEQDGVAW